MPTYQVEAESSSGPECFPFTVDHDRPLFPQVIQILEELRGQGIIVVGGPDAELGAFWNGKELDLDRTPADLGITPVRPLELRMRRRTAVAAPVPTRPRGPVASVLLGMVGGFVAWLVLLQLRVLSPVIPGYLRLDQVAALILGGVTGAAILGGHALRTRESVPLWGAAGLLVGGTGALLGATLALLAGSRGPTMSFLAQRVLAWGLAALVPAALMAAAVRRGDLRRGWLAPVLAGLAAVISAVCLSQSILGELWLGLACLIFGAGMGLAAGISEHAGALGTLRRVSAAASPDRPLAIREWVVRPGCTAVVRAPGLNFELIAANSEALLRAQGMTDDVLVHGTLVEIGPEKLQYSASNPS
jgi:hypothetical protein